MSTLDKLTPELLKAAGFVRIDADKTTEKLELRTKWQTIHIWHNFIVPFAPYRVGGIIHTDDRVTVKTTGELFDALCLFGADQETRNHLFKHLVGDI